MVTKFNRSTISVRSGLNSDEQHGCVVSPITLSTTYNFIGFKQPRLYDYSRRKNPTRDVTQKAIADLEQGKYAIITSSGMAAIYLICVSFLRSGDLLIAPHDCYGGTYRLFQSLHRKGVFRVKFIDQNNVLDMIKYIDIYNPKIVFIETPSNPMLRIVDLKKIFEVKKSDTIYVVDNTFMTPIFQSPLVLGADLVVHSCSKYLNGHSDVISGIVISNNFEFFESLEWWSNTLGITGSAFDSYQLLRGIRTLVPRVYQQQKNAKKIIDFLLNHSMISIIYYPGLKTHLGYGVACQQQRGFGSIFSFELKGNENTLRKFLKSLKLFTLAESFGGVESLIAHPSTMTHAAMSENDRNTAGISDMLLRVSVGLEDSDDLIYDLDTSLRLLQRN